MNAVFTAIEWGFYALCAMPFLYIAARLTTAAILYSYRDHITKMWTLSTKNIND